MTSGYMNYHSLRQILIIVDISCAGNGCFGKVQLKNALPLKIYCLLLGDYNIDKQPSGKQER